MLLCCLISSFEQYHLILLLQAHISIVEHDNSNVMYVYVRLSVTLEARGTVPELLVTQLSLSASLKGQFFTLRIYIFWGVMIPRPLG